jgi:hypothetical protein
MKCASSSSCVSRAAWICCRSCTRAPVNVVLARWASLSADSVASSMVCRASWLGPATMSVRCMAVRSAGGMHLQEQQSSVRPSEHKVTAHDSLMICAAMWECGGMCRSQDACIALLHNPRYAPRKAKQRTRFANCLLCILWLQLMFQHRRHQPDHSQQLILAHG